jgi:hypothetical protein
MALDLRDAVSDSLMKREIWDESVDDLDLDAEEAERAGSVVFTWRNEYLMIGAAYDGGGMFVDQRPGPDQGCVRWWDKVEADCHKGYASISLRQLTTDLAPAVRDRTPIAGWVPTVVDGALDWDVPG